MVRSPKLVFRYVNDRYRTVKWEHDAAVAYHGMHGGFHTRIRLASGKPAELGRWEKVCNLDTWSPSYIARVLPPECVAPGGMKMRSPRRDVTLKTLLAAARKTAWPFWSSAELNALLDRPAEEIEALATMNRLRKVVA